MIGRIIEFLVYVAAVVLLELVLHSKQGLSLLWGVIILLIIAPIQFILVVGVPEISAWAAAKRQWVNRFVVTVSLIIFVSLLAWANRMNITLEHSWYSISQYFVIGALLGIMLRQLVGWFFISNFIGNPVSIQKYAFLLSFLATIWLLPIGNPQIANLSCYVLGLGTGYMIHFTVRTRQRGRAQFHRTGQTILEMFSDSEIKDRFSPIETEAIRNFAKHNFRALKKLLHKQQELSSVLTIIKFAMERSQGNYPKCLHTIETELANDRRDPDLESQLYCCRALCRSDAGGGDDMMFKDLERALEIRTKQKNDCVLARISLSLRLAEKVPMEGDEDNQDRVRSFWHIWRALKLYAKGIPLETLELVIGVTVPISWTLILDAYGFSLLKLNDMRLSKSVLTYCIYVDPGFSSPYLHLGEWHLTEAMTKQNQYEKFHQNELAKYCFLMAKYLEGKKESRIKRRADELIKKHFRSKR